MTCTVLLVSGSLRERSTNTAVLRTARAVAPAGVACVLYDGLADLPHFSPDDDVEPLHPAVAALRAEIHAADAVVFSTPEYAGALPGSFKNLLDWTIGDDQPGSIYEKPVTWLNVSTRGAVDAHESLRKVLGFAHATVLDEQPTAIPITESMIGDDGLVTDASVRARLVDALTRLTGRVCVETP
jgi:NAD(P)H-dependent FMN reductase